MKLLLVQGANMERLGRRAPELYGTTTAAELDALLLDRAADRGCTLEIVYTNQEAEAIEAIYRAADAGVQGLLINPAGFCYAGYALRDCIRESGLPAVEVHMTNLVRRGTRSVTRDVAQGYVAGLGIGSYLVGFDGLVALIKKREAA